jgi:proteasome lid subunit RPN8/RPN11
MIILDASQLREIEAAGEASFPGECCGLLVGQDVGGMDVRVSRVVASPNLQADARDDRFEVDPQIQFDLMRALRGTAERIVGHYHSHPNHPARPSKTDAAKLFDTEMIWLITAVANGKAVETRAFQPITPAPDEVFPFTDCELHVVDTPTKP